MLITCPNCAAGYDVPEHLLAGEVRRLRCARCAVEWDAREAFDQNPLQERVQAMMAEPIGVPPPPRVEPTAAQLAESWHSRQDDDATIHADMRVPPPLEHDPADTGITLTSDVPTRRIPSEPPRLSALVAAWILSLVFVGSLGWGVWHWRDDVMTIFPPSQRAFGAISQH
jgi:predicted Zn finger-like uncharacterized protein